MLQVESKGSLPSSVAKRMNASEFAVETDMMLDTHVSLHTVGKCDLEGKIGMGDDNVGSGVSPHRLH